MNIILLVGISIFAGTLLGKGFQVLKIPQVSGYIVVGLLMGTSFLGLWQPETIERLTTLTSLVLGLIGFMLGAELQVSVFKNRGRSIYSILFCQGLMTFFLVVFLVYLVTRKLYLGILLGAIATATDPASTVDVLWENKARGPLASTLMAIVALDDVLALIIYAFGLIVAKAMIIHAEFSFDLLLHALKEIGTAVLIGSLSGFLLLNLLKFIKDRKRILPFAFGVIALTVGLALAFKIDVILSTMLAGVILVNKAPQESGEMFDAIKKFMPPLYVLFFVLVGARLNIAIVFGSGATLVLLALIFGRSLGKFVGSYLGGVIGQASSNVKKYVGLGLFPQAGVAIGMAISIGHNLSHLGPESEQIGLTIINLAVASTFVFQIIGPPCVKLAVVKAGETGRDVTEEDIIDSYKVSDVVNQKVPIIREDYPLDAIVELVKSSDADQFCVVDSAKKLLGLISIGDLRSVLLEQELDLNILILARDIAVPVANAVRADCPLNEAIHIFNRKNIDILPVVDDDISNELVGMIHYRTIMSTIQKEVLRRRGNI
ncbi:MAG: cation:proton antiporter [Candidatus Omnitrophica bacterium]|nr:cation:proton antiporter [Candidatus Omnitrophota bacterium]